jgi:hypothetical protein
VTYIPFSAALFWVLDDMVLFDIVQALSEISLWILERRRDEEE